MTKGRGHLIKTTTKDPFPFVIRMPLSLRNKLVEEAYKEDLTLNSYLVKVLTERMEEIEIKRSNEVEHFTKLLAASGLIQEEW